MATFARNLTGIKEIRPPKVAQHHNKRTKQRTTQRNRLDRGIRIGTREMKLHIAILDAWLSNPVELAKMSKEEQGGMRKKLDFYRAELAKRDERDNRPLTADALAQKFVQAAPRGRQNGFRVQHA